MGTGGECPHRTMCFRQQNSHNPVFLTSWGSEQKKLPLLDCSFPMSKSCSQLLRLITGLISCICFSSCHIHLYHHPSHSEASARANHCISGNLPSPYCVGQTCRNGDGQDSAHLLHAGLELPNSKQRVTVTLNLCGLHNSWARFLCPVQSMGAAPGTWERRAGATAALSINCAKHKPCHAAKPPHAGTFCCQSALSRAKPPRGSHRGGLLPPDSLSLAQSSHKRGAQQ